METALIKSRLQKLIQQENDVNVLQAIYTILEKTSFHPVLKSKLTTRAEKAEQDIATGKLFTTEDVVKRTDRIGK